MGCGTESMEGFLRYLKRSKASVKSGRYLTEAILRGDFQGAFKEAIFNYQILPAERYPVKFLDKWHGSMI
jgi:hypothetical protein